MSQGMPGAGAKGTIGTDVRLKQCGGLQVGHHAQVVLASQLLNKQLGL